MSDEALIREIALAIGGPEDDGVEGAYWELDLASARAILPIIRRREIEAGEKVRGVIAEVVAPASTHCFCDSCRISRVHETDINALDVAAIIGGEHDQ